MNGARAIAKLAVLASCSIALTATADSGAAETNDWLVIPGQRVGPITPRTTHADLVRMFGAKNVQDDEIAITDGDRELGTKVFADQPTSYLAILWKDDTPDSSIRRIIFCDASEPLSSCKWHTADGITLGTPLKTIEKANGRKFKLNGFDWGYGGLITSWEGGRLERFAGACGAVTLRLDPRPEAPSDQRSELLERVEEDAEFWSSDPAMQALDPTVDHMSISFQNCEK